MMFGGLRGEFDDNKKDDDDDEAGSSKIFDPTAEIFAWQR